MLPLLGLISHEDSLEFLRSLGRAAGAEALDAILARALAEGLQVLAPPIIPPDEQANWCDDADAIGFAIECQEEVLTSYTDLAAPTPAPLLNRVVADLTAAGGVPQDWMEKLRQI